MNRLKCGLIALPALLLLACANPVNGPAEDRAAVLVVGEAMASPAEPHDAGWEVSLDFAAFDQDQALFIQGLSGQDFGFQLGEHSAREGDVRRGWVIQADEPHDRRGSFTLTRQGQRVAGRIQLAGHIYSLRGGAEGYYLLRIDPEQMPSPSQPVVPENDRHSD